MTEEFMHKVKGHFRLLDLGLIELKAIYNNLLKYRRIDDYIRVLISSIVTLEFSRLDELNDSIKVLSNNEKVDLSRIRNALVHFINQHLNAKGDNRMNALIMTVDDMIQKIDNCLLKLEKSVYAADVNAAIDSKDIDEYIDSRKQFIEKQSDIILNKFSVFFIDIKNDEGVTDTNE